MKTTSWLAAALLFTVVGLAACTSDKSTKEQADEEGQGLATEQTPATEDKDWWVPMHSESVTALNNARFQYRQNEEKTAASEIRKAASWLAFAQKHAEAMTKENLQTAHNELVVLADDLDAGNVTDASRMDRVLAHTSQALAEWHYYKAVESYGIDESDYAAKHLQAAVTHLEHAANSAHYEYDPETITVFRHYHKNGASIVEEKTLDNNEMTKDFDVIKQAIEDMSEALGEQLEG